MKELKKQLRQSMYECRLWLDQIIQNEGQPGEKKHHKLKKKKKRKRNLKEKHTTTDREDSKLHIYLQSIGLTVVITGNLGCQVSSRLYVRNSTVLSIVEVCHIR